MTALKNKKLSKILDRPNIAWLNICLEKSTDFVSVVPCVQVRITDSSVTLASVRSKLLELDLQWEEFFHGGREGTLCSNDQIFHLTQESYHGKKVHKALLIHHNGIDEYIDNSVTSFAYVTSFDALTTVLPEHLEWLSIACPNLQRLNLSGNHRCLSDL